MKKRVESYFYRAVRKLHMQELVYRVLSPFARKTRLDTPELARKELEHVSANLGTSALHSNRILPPEWDLTIIIPAYNVEKYMDACLSTVLKQVTQYSYRVVVINDGSVDNTAKILEKYREHALVSVISQDNGGAARARNRALECIRSRYVMFVDADDILEPGAVEKLLRKAYEADADIVEGGYYTFSNPDQKRYCTVCPPGVYSDPYGVITGFTCMKVLKSELFRSVAFPEGYWFEDTLLSMLIFPQVHRVARIDDVVYGYRTNPEGSTARADMAPKSIDSLWVTESMMLDLDRLGLRITPALYMQLLLQCKISFVRTSGLPDSVCQWVFVLACELAENYDQGYVPEDRWFVRLKQALLERSYGQYCLICNLMES